MDLIKHSSFSSFSQSLLSSGLKTGVQGWTFGALKTRYSLDYSCLWNNPIKWVLEYLEIYSEDQVAGHVLTNVNLARPVFHVSGSG